ncbi:hypothetical protein FNJ87_00760 [Nonlabens mediterrranea]|uniref:Uncharacterized protein n=1 Tax=Nonlabens mediterrranea TaxID=1419947 RepID=A0ABS0A0N5_9FLAO|nr:hypothetical protein [Nonlabens mediterrranea]
MFKDKRKLFLIFVGIGLLTLIGYRLISAFDLVNKNENLVEPADYSNLFKNNDSLIDLVRVQRNQQSGIYSIYNINNYDYGMLITKFEVDCKIPLDSIVDINSNDNLSRYDYGQGSIFKTDFFYTYYQNERNIKLNISYASMKDSFIQKQNDSLLYLSIPLNGDLSISVDNEKHSFIYVENGLFSDRETFEICFKKFDSQVYMILLKAINKKSLKEERFNLNQLLDI